METAQKRIAADGESKLPDEIIQHIQSLMSERDAARTTLLSKSWHGAWCTRPNLCLDPFTFRYRMDEFPIFARKSMQRYEDSNLKIKSFKLWVEGDDDSDLARELILKAIKLGATDLTIDVPTWVSINLPYEVLESETLARLSVQNVSVDFKKRNKAVNSSNLKSLHLSNVTVKGDLIRDLISRCPSIEELTLRNLRRSSRFYCDDDTMIEVHKLIKLHKLKYLRLDGLPIKDGLSKHDLWPQFACLKELVIENINLDYVRICSPSLERITIHLHEFRNVMVAEFDVPNIRYFKFEGTNKIPSLKFRAKDGREWESDIRIHIRPRRSGSATSASWFSSLKQLVKMLSPSRVSLSIFMGDDGYGYGYVGDGLATPAVENLTLRGFGLTSVFMDALLWSCCPNFIDIEKGYAEMVDLKVYKQLKKKKTLLDAAKKRNHGEILHFQRK
ncbi:putative F-box/LRR-repeat protein At3g44080 [Salvia miltiorrhiza]|uniref:putative F-box/LRR-repeat protein At3g44080 n=1 Tax=Salvia miltiorrhiza TaxID=226208 RepID=UPI0025ACBA68|nr:putative F-box/LRR-repeat protein At3g44080 [Salvia miltiorrhiza]